MLLSKPPFLPIAAPSRTHISIIILPLPRPPLIPPRPILPNRNLNPLRREALAQIRALNDAGEFLRAENMEDVAEAGCEDGGGGGVEFVFALWAADVYEIHF